MERHDLTERQYEPDDRLAAGHRGDDRGRPPGRAAPQPQGSAPRLAAIYADALGAEEQGLAARMRA